MPEAIDWREARRIIQTAAVSFITAAVENVTLNEAHGRILAQAVRADRNYPAMARSLRDGFAIRSADAPGSLEVFGERRAGEDLLHLGPLEQGHALEIMTGAPVPAGADAVVMVEHTRRESNRVFIERAAEPGQFINQEGSEIKSGERLVEAGTRLDASHIAALAMAGCSDSVVYKTPRIAILPTGDELAASESDVAPHLVRNSNGPMLAALVKASGGEPHVLPVAPDREEKLSQSLVKGLTFDMLLVSGGVSAGKYDLVKPCLRNLGVEFLFERVRIQPGQPTVFGIFKNKPVFGLPGNPGSTLVTFQLFGALALALLAGERSPVLPILAATLAAPFRHKPGLTRFLPATLGEDGVHLTHIPWQGSSDIPALARANAFLVADGNRAEWNAGDCMPALAKL